MARRKQKRNSGKRGMSVGLMTLGCAANAAYQLGFANAVSNLANGGSIGSSFQTIASSVNVGTVVNSIVPFVVTSVAKRVVGQKTIFGPLKLF